MCFNDMQRASEREEEGKRRYTRMGKLACGGEVDLSVSSLREAGQNQEGEKI
jgi:hypothetical protein